MVATFAQSVTQHDEPAYSPTVLGLRSHLL
jgi:hypothetical protein